VAIYFCAMYLLGGSFGPVVTGRLSDHFAAAAMVAAGGGTTAAASRAIGLHNAMYVIPICALGVAVVLLAAAVTVTRDMAKLQAWMAGPGNAPECAVDGAATPESV